MVARALYCSPPVSIITVFGSPCMGRENGPERKVLDQPPRWSSSWPVPCSPGVRLPSA